MSNQEQVPTVICLELTAQERADYLPKLDADVRNGKLELADLAEMHCDGWITGDELFQLANGDDEPSDKQVYKSIDKMVRSWMEEDGIEVIE